MTMIGSHGNESVPTLTADGPPPDGAGPAPVAPDPDGSDELELGEVSGIADAPDAPP